MSQYHWALIAAQREARKEFDRVMAFLDAAGYHVGKGHGDREKVAHHGGHTMEQLAEGYALREGKP